MSTPTININRVKYQIGESTREGEPEFSFVDLSGEHLGVRVEVLPVGGTSSRHHYHTAEEEHVLVLEGQATLYLGDEEYELDTGDHLCFKAGEAVAHHIKNTSDAFFKYLIFGERKQHDVVFYPERSRLLVKSPAGIQVYDYKESS